MKSAKTIVIVATVFFAALCLSLHSAAKVAPTPERATQTPVKVAPATPPRIKKRLSPIGKVIKPPEIMYKDSVIMLEAFIVEVRLSYLYSLGVPQISEGSKSVSAEHILKLLKTTDAATVTAGAKLALTHKNKARTGSTTRKAIYTDPPNNTKTEFIDVGTSFTAFAEIRKEKTFAELEFQYSDIVKADKNANAIPQIVENNWASSICLNSGEPTLIGATQGEQTGAFLIVTANIQE
jgi:hypothetical protein